MATGGSPDRPPTLEYAERPPRLGRAGEIALCVLGLLVAVPPLLLLGGMGFLGVYTHWPRNYTDAGEPWRLGFLGVAGFAATRWVVWRVVKVLRRRL